jgi:hypothetical protein
MKAGGQVGSNPFEPDPIVAVVTDRPNPARMYDYYLGGSHNLQVDRDAADAAERAWPGIGFGAQANRAFLHRATGFLAAAGIDQFLDLGSGIPTVGNVHEIAQQVNPAARVVYVDAEPVAYHASKALLADVPNADIVHADLRDIDRVLGDPLVADMLATGRPVGLMMVAVLHFVPDDDDPARLVSDYLAAMPAGSCLTLSHGTPPWLLPAREHDDPETANEQYQRSTNPVYFRTVEQIAPFFAGVELVEPGLVHVLDWRPDDRINPNWKHDRIAIHAGVGRKTN